MWVYAKIYDIDTNETVMRWVGMHSLTDKYHEMTPFRSLHDATTQSDVIEGWLSEADEQIRVSECEMIIVQSNQIITIREADKPWLKDLAV